jgi:hypothetical protein
METLLCDLPKIRHDGVRDVLTMILVRQGRSVAPCDEGGEEKFAEPSFTGPVEVWGKDPNRSDSPGDSKEVLGRKLGEPIPPDGKVGHTGVVGAAP